MNLPLTFVRIFFLLLSLLLFTTYTAANTPADGSMLLNALVGGLAGIAFALTSLLFERLVTQANLKGFMVIAIGLFFGYLLAEGVNLVLERTVYGTSVAMTDYSLGFIRTGVYLFCIFLGTILTAKASEELYVSLPFVRFKPTTQKKKDIILDISILNDPRLIDLCASGIFDNHLIFPRFILKELNLQLESADESTRNRARRGLDVVKKLENNPTLDMRYSDTDFIDAKDMMSKLVRLARMLDATILTADLNRVQQSSIEGVRILNIHSLSNALKPLTQSGEFITIKVQRYGKEPRQGVGYLDDGTMVVVNGGAEFIGETIKAQVLSVKHTSSGRMIFCNAFEEGENGDLIPIGEIENPHKNYFAV